MKNLIRGIAVLLTAVFLCFNIYYELAPGITVAPEQKFVFAAIFAVLLVALLYLFFGTELGASIRATGINAAMSRDEDRLHRELCRKPRLFFWIRMNKEETPMQIRWSRIVRRNFRNGRM